MKKERDAVNRGIDDAAGAGIFAGVKGAGNAAADFSKDEVAAGFRIDRETAIGLYTTMVRIRKFEEKLYELFLTRPMPGSMHQYNGQEAVAAGICAHLHKDDYVTSTHRGHGHCIAKGADTRAVMAEMFAKKTGCCRGMGGSMHIADFGVGMLGATGIVGAGIPIAVGAGWTCRFRAKGQVSVAFFGDGAANEGAFHEGMNLAAVWKLPVIFACENNVYGFSTHYRRTTAVEHIADRAPAYGMQGKVVDGMDARAVYAEAGEAIASARGGGGPTLLEFKTYRFMGHSRFEKSSYRSPAEVEEWKRRDPIPRLRDWMASELGVSAKETEGIEAAAARELEEAVSFAENSPDPDPDDWKKYLFA
jgi:TPP-dependent pyruvate/acetoin dehydrogenase alpha subunit